MGTLVTLEIAPDSPVLELPWIITFGPLNDFDDWEPVVCGPYERAHALALAESIVTDEELMAVVEPLQPYVTLDQIRGDIAAVRLAAAGDGAAAADPDLASAFEPDLGSDVDDAPDLGSDFEPDPDDDGAPVEPTPLPTPEEIRAGFGRIAARLTRA